jgi:hypothetical protein
MKEAAVIIGYDDEPIFWHAPADRSVGAIPDSRPFWDVIWENRDSIAGIAHSHPGGGVPAPSREDITTFAGVEKGLGKRLNWWIATNAIAVVLCRWTGPHKYDYEVLRVGAGSPWVEELLRISEGEVRDA